MSEERGQFIYEVVLQQSDDPYGPPEKPLITLARIGDDLFIEAVQHEETNKKITRTVKATYVLRWAELVPALNALDLAHR